MKDKFNKIGLFLFGSGIAIIVTAAAVVFLGLVALIVYVVMTALGI